MTKLVVANWKLNLTANDARWWMDAFAETFEPDDSYEVAIAPSFAEISVVADKLEQHDIDRDVKLFSQDISVFEKGKYTGEVSGLQLIEHGVTGAIIGHSERRGHLNETPEMINEKAFRAEENGLTPVVCVSRLEQVEYLQQLDKITNLVVAYEPLDAIGSGKPEDLSQVDKFLQEVRYMLGKTVITIYGGSVDGETVSTYLESDLIEGFLVGTASVDPTDFLAILEGMRES